MTLLQTDIWGALLAVIIVYSSYFQYLVSNIYIFFKDLFFLFCFFIFIFQKEAETFGVCQGGFNQWNLGIVCIVLSEWFCMLI